MSINYTIQADVIDIKADEPKGTDVFLVDSNVWFWVTYTSASTTAEPYQTLHYPAYVDKALAAGARICRSGLSMEELAHLIEETQWQIYSSYVQKVKAKEYRHNFPDERTRVVSEVQVAWTQVKTMAEPVNITIDDATTDAALYSFQNHGVGGYDLFILETMARQNVLQIMTDDGDFATVPGIKVFTANRNILKAAHAQGRIVTRSA